jgi:hypothetical protein
MPGKAGTVRFGINPPVHEEKASADGVSRVDLQIDGPWQELHYAYNPSQYSRPMGSTRGADPGKDNADVKRQADYMSNHDGYLAGDIHLLNNDERKILDNHIYSVNCEWADPGYPDTSDNGWAPRQTMTAFD